MSLWFDPRSSRSQMFLKIGVLKNFVTFTGKQLELDSELEFDLRDTVDWGNKWLVDFNAGKTQLVSFARSNINGSIDVKMDGFFHEEKS